MRTKTATRCPSRHGSPHVAEIVCHETRSSGSVSRSRGSPSRSASSGRSEELGVQRALAAARVLHLDVDSPTPCARASPADLGGDARSRSGSTRGASRRAARGRRPARRGRTPGAEEPQRRRAAWRAAWERDRGPPRKQPADPLRHCRRGSWRSRPRISRIGGATSARRARTEAASQTATRVSQSECDSPGH